MHNILSRNLTSTKPLANFTTIYRKVTENVNSKRSSKEKQLPETEQKNVEESCEEEKKPIEEVRKKFSLKVLSRSLVPSYQPISAISMSSRKSFYFPNIHNKNLMCNKRMSNFENSTKTFKSLPSQGFYRNGLEQCLKIRNTKPKLFKHVHKRNKVNAIGYLVNLESLRNANLSNKLKKQFKHPIFVHPEPEVRHELRSSQPIQVDKKKFKIVYPTHLNKFKTGFFNQRNFSKKKEPRKFPSITKKQETDKSDENGNIKFSGFRNYPRPKVTTTPRPNVYKMKHVKIQNQKASLDTVKLKKGENTIEFVPGEFKPRLKNLLKLKKTENPPITVNMHPTLKETDASAKMAINKKYNILLMRKQQMLTPSDQESKTSRRTMEARKKATSMNTDDEIQMERRHETVYKDLNKNVKRRPRSLISEKKENFDIDEICLKSNEKYISYSANESTAAKTTRFHLEDTKPEAAIQTEQRIDEKEPILIDNMRNQTISRQYQRNIRPTHTRPSREDPKIIPAGPAKPVVQYLDKLNDIENNQLEVDSNNKIKKNLEMYDRIDRQRSRISAKFQSKWEPDEPIKPASQYQNLLDSSNLSEKHEQPNKIKHHKPYQHVMKKKYKNLLDNYIPKDKSDAEPAAPAAPLRREIFEQMLNRFKCMGVNESNISSENITSHKQKEKNASTDVKSANEHVQINTKEIQEEVKDTKLEVNTEEDLMRELNSHKMNTIHQEQEKITTTDDVKSPDEANFIYKSANEYAENRIKEVPAEKDYKSNKKEIEVMTEGDLMRQLKSHKMYKTRELQEQNTAAGDAETQIKSSNDSKFALVKSAYDQVEVRTKKLPEDKDYNLNKKEDTLITEEGLMHKFKSDKMHKRQEQEKNTTTENLNSLDEARFVINRFDDKHVENRTEEMPVEVKDCRLNKKEELETIADEDVVQELKLHKVNTIQSDDKNNKASYLEEKKNTVKSTNAEDQRNKASHLEEDRQIIKSKNTVQIKDNLIEKILTKIRVLQELARGDLVSDLTEVAQVSENKENKSNQIKNVGNKEAETNSPVKVAIRQFTDHNLRKTSNETKMKTTENTKKENMIIKPLNIKNNTLKNEKSKTGDPHDELDDPEVIIVESDGALRENDKSSFDVHKKLTENRPTIRRDRPPTPSIPPSKSPQKKPPSKIKKELILPPQKPSDETKLETSKVKSKKSKINLQTAIIKKEDHSNQASVRDESKNSFFFQYLLTKKEPLTSSFRKSDKSIKIKDIKLSESNNKIVEAKNIVVKEMTEDMSNLSKKPILITVNQKLLFQHPSEVVLNLNTNGNKLQKSTKSSSEPKIIKANDFGKSCESMKTKDNTSSSPKSISLQKSLLPNQNENEDEKQNIHWFSNKPRIISHKQKLSFSHLYQCKDLNSNADVVPKNDSDQINAGEQEKANNQNLVLLKMMTSHDNINENDICQQKYTPKTEKISVNSQDREVKNIKEVKEKPKFDIMTTSSKEDGKPNKGHPKTLQRKLQSNTKIDYRKPQTANSEMNDEKKLVQTILFNRPLTTSDINSNKRAVSMPTVTKNPKNDMTDAKFDGDVPKNTTERIYSAKKQNVLKEAKTVGLKPVTQQKLPNSNANQDDKNKPLQSKLLNMYMLEEHEHKVESIKQKNLSQMNILHEHDPINQTAVKKGGKLNKSTYSKTTETNKDKDKNLVQVYMLEENEYIDQKVGKKRSNLSEAAYSKSPKTKKETSDKKKKPVGDNDETENFVLKSISHNETNMRTKSTVKATKQQQQEQDENIDIEKKQKTTISEQFNENALFTKAENRILDGKEETGNKLNKDMLYQLVDTVEPGLTILRNPQENKNRNLPKNKELVVKPKIILKVILPKAKKELEISIGKKDETTETRKDELQANKPLHVTKLLKKSSSKTQKVELEAEKSSCIVQNSSNTLANQENLISRENRKPKNLEEIHPVKSHQKLLDNSKIETKIKKRRNLLELYSSYPTNQDLLISDEQVSKNLNPIESKHVDKKYLLESPPILKGDDTTQKKDHKYLLEDFNDATQNAIEEDLQKRLQENEILNLQNKATEDKTAKYETSKLGSNSIQNKLDLKQQQMIQNKVETEGCNPESDQLKKYAENPLSAFYSKTRKKLETTIDSKSIKTIKCSHTNAEGEPVKAEICEILPQTESVYRKLFHQEQVYRSIFSQRSLSDSEITNSKCSDLKSKLKNFNKKLFDIVISNPDLTDEKSYLAQSSEVKNQKNSMQIFLPKKLRREKYYITSTKLIPPSFGQVFVAKNVSDVKPQQRKERNELNNRINLFSSLYFPFKNLSNMLFSRQNEETTTLDKKFDEKIIAGKNMPVDHLTKYKDLKITHMEIKKPTNKEVFVPLSSPTREKTHVLKERFEYLKDLYEDYKLAQETSKNNEYYGNLESNDNLSIIKFKINSVSENKTDKGNDNFSKSIEQQKEVVNTVVNINPNQVRKNKVEIFIKKLKEEDTCKEKKEGKDGEHDSLNNPTDFK